VNLFSSEPSQGKDALWELQLLAIFRSWGLNASLAEPDIIVRIGTLEIPVACKKIYSGKNLEDQLRSAGRQLSRFKSGGVAALNLDAQLPQDQIISCRTFADSSKILTKAYDFLGDRQELVRRFVKEGKFDGLLVSISCPVDNLAVQPRFNVSTESFIWCPPDICSEAGRARMAALREAMKMKELIRD
jgi:hypothetical protein